ncbi:glutaminyl-peptide cyclotransferase [Streptomyces sp. NPDC096030]|uniref:glutaminyl-peptide cyclotransferase n=1 Tax=Streptomyces sp. NPDC096030 TaxID=3155423 RepID=UPI00332A9CC3
MRAFRIPAVAVGAALIAALSVLAVPGDTRGGREDRTAAGTGVAQQRARVLEVLRHDPAAFTQGLEMHGGRLLESTGGFGRSAVSAGKPGGAAMMRTALPDGYFGEGLTVVGRNLWQLTWRNKVAIERSAQTLEEIRRVPYPAEGWGICYQPDRHRLVSSDGSAWLTFRDPATLAGTGRVQVTYPGPESRPVSGLNELECAGAHVYANVYGSRTIVRIDSGTGHVSARIDCASLPGTGTYAGVLNGIAALPQKGQFLITGKNWPQMFRVLFENTPSP